MEKWEEMMKASQQAFETRYFYTALEFCQRALKHAVQNFETSTSHDNETLLTAVMVSHFNLADTHVALNQIKQAVEVYEEISIYLERLLLDNSISDYRKNAALRAGGCLHIEWNRFFQQNRKKLPPDITYSLGLQLH